MASPCDRQEQRGCPFKEVKLNRGRSMGLAKARYHYEDILDYGCAALAAKLGKDFFL
jgi:hypothetical protein